MNKALTSQKGVALFQVLLITSIITILAIQFTQTAKNQIAIAKMIVDRTNALMNLKTTESDLLFTLLTQQRESSNQNKITKKWNFFNKPFYLENGISIEIQDQYSLLSLYKGMESKKIELLINKVAGDDVNASVVTNSLVDWQDSDSLKRINGAEKSDYPTEGMPSNLPFQFLNELQFVNGVNSILLDKLNGLVTIRPQSYFNPLNAPKYILLLTLDSQKVESIIQLRDNGILTKAKFTSLTNISQDEGLFFSTSGLLKVKIYAEVNDVKLNKLMELYIQPYNSHPLIEYESKY